MEQAAVAAPGDARPGYYFEDLAIGMSADFRRVIGDEEMRLFADLTGDTNPLHFDDDFAERSRFGGRIVHGMCTAALISTVIGTRLPGPGCIYLSQTLRFTAPVVESGPATRSCSPAGRGAGGGGSRPHSGAPARRVRDHGRCSVGDQIVLAGRARGQFARAVFPQPV